MEYILQTISSRATQRMAAGDAVYQYAIPLNNSSIYTQHMKTILNRLKSQFPGSTVSHTLLVHGTDGKVYDLANIDENTLHIADKVLENSYIVLKF